MKKSFSFRSKADFSNHSPYLGECLVHTMKCLEGTPEDDKKEKWSQQVLKGNRSEKETKEQLQLSIKWSNWAAKRSGCKKSFIQTPSLNSVSWTLTTLSLGCRSSVIDGLTSDTYRIRHCSANIPGFAPFWTNYVH